MSRPVLLRRVFLVLVAGAIFLARSAEAQTVPPPQPVQNTVVTYQYDAVGNVTQVADALGNVSDFSFDSLNRMSQVIQPVPSSGVARPTINMTYDGVDQLSTLSDPRQLKTSFTIDGLGNQTVLSSPDTGSAVLSYDSAGNVLTRTDARGKIAAFNYDALNRLTRVTYPGGLSTVFEYDGGPTPAPNAIGRLTSMTDEAGQTSYAYGSSGRLASKSQRSNGPSAAITLKVSYEYGPTGKLLKVTYPSGNQIGYSYDSTGQIASVTLSSTVNPTTSALLTNVSRIPFGGLKGWYWGGDSTNSYERAFDLDGRITRYPLGPTASSTALVRSVSYDAIGRVVALTHSGAANASDHDQSFTYDGLGRLLSVTTANGAQGYAYDASGNRVQISIGGATFSSQIATNSNRILAAAGPLPATTNAFDSNGNVISDGTINYTYSDRGRLNTVTRDGVTTTYQYNGLGQRVLKSAASIATGANAYFYDEQGRLLGEYDGAGNAIQETVYLGETPVAVLKMAADGLSTRVYYVFADHINTPKAIVDAASGAVVWKWIDVDPFGRSYPEENPSGAGIFTYNPRFPGQLFDRETNNHYNYHRDYSPQLGRYLQSDPIGLESGINTYAYVENNPVNSSDPFGLQTMVLPGGLPVPGVGGPSAERNLEMARSLARDMKKERPNKTFQTYTRYNPKTNQCYSGRTSGYESPELNIRQRAYGQPLLNKEGFDPPVLDKSSEDAAAIRGREQDLIEINGGAQASNGYSRNMINGIGWANPLGPIYREAALEEFGPAIKSGRCTCNK